MVNCYQKSIEGIVVNTFPEKEIKIYPDDKPWYNEENEKNEAKTLYERKKK